MSVLSSISSSPILLLLYPSVHQQRVKLYEPGRAQGFVLLKGEFFLPLLPVEGRTLGFCKGPGDNLGCNRRSINR